MKIVRLLQEIKDKKNISYEIMDLSGGETEKQVYDKDFKPRAKILKQRTGKSIYKELRGKRSHRYYISLPGAIAIIKDGQVEWWTYTEDEILHFLNQVLYQGQNFLERPCSKEAT